VLTGLLERTEKFFLCTETFWPGVLGGAILSSLICGERKTPQEERVEKALRRVRRFV